MVDLENIRLAIEKGIQLNKERIEQEENDKIQQNLIKEKQELERKQKIKDRVKNKIENIPKYIIDSLKKGETFIKLYGLGEIEDQEIKDTKNLLIEESNNLKLEHFIQGEKGWEWTCYENGTSRDYIFYNLCVKIPTVNNLCKNFY